jgi:hypothetical protein
METLLFNYEKKNFAIYSDITDSDNSLYVEFHEDSYSNSDEQRWAECTPVSVTRRGREIMPVILRAERIYKLDICRILADEKQRQADNSFAFMF